MNKKGMSREDELVLELFIMVILFLLLCSYLYYLQDKSFKKEANEKCQELGLKVFDLYNSDSITCIDEISKEIKRIR